MDRTNPRWSILTVPNNELASTVNYIDVGVGDEMSW